MIGDEVKPEVEAEYWKDLIAPESDEEDENNLRPKNIEEYRKKLLEGLDDISEDND